MANRTMTTGAPNEDEIDLLAFWGLFWTHRLKIVFITGVFALGSVIYALSLDNTFRSDVILAAAEDNQPSSALLGQLGAAAGLVGINTGIGDTTKTSTALATLQSRSFIREFISRHGIMPALMASEWSAEEGRNVIDPSIYDEENRVWLQTEPTDLDAYKVFDRILGVSENSSNGLITVSIEWTDPTQAKDWAEKIVNDINRLIKQQDLQEAQDAIEYLQGQLQATQLVEMQRAFYQLIESQTRIVMLADVREDYVFRIIDPAYVPEEKASPNRTFICIVGTLLGFALSLLLVLIHNAILQAKESY